jgi:DNA helicase-4
MLHIIKPSYFGGLFSSINKIEIHDNDIVIFNKSGSTKSINLTEACNFPKVEKKIFSSILVIQSPENITLKHLNSKDCSRVIKHLQSVVKEPIEQLIIRANEFFSKYARDEYLRDSSLDKLTEYITPILNNYKGNLAAWQANIDNAYTQFLDELADMHPFKENKGVIRENFEKKILQERKPFYDFVESNPLTPEQRLSVVRDNDRNLVLAAAGTGKTSVMIAKALDLVDRQVAKSDEILILAYNKSAATELKERFLLRRSTLNVVYELPTIMTFHALGVKILREANIHTYLSKFSEDPNKLIKWLTDWVSEKIISDTKFMQIFIDLLYEPTNPFSIKTKEEYELLTRDSNYRTLNGDMVKGYQELLISNWLYLNGVEYEYEAQYKKKKRLVPGVNYSPDFYLIESDIYLEHFGIDRNGNTRPDIDAHQYNEHIKLKRQLHQEQGTTLIETFHYDWVEKNLESRLSELINSNGITLKPRTKEEVFKKLNSEGLVNRGVKKYIKCLQAIRVEQLSDNDILNRLKEFKISNADKYTILLGQIHSAYREELIQQNCIDFDDMIIRATSAVEQSDFSPTFSHILVDEFQDISAARLSFLKALIKHGKAVRFTAVGDDWQSIYRFSGGKLELTTRFDELVGTHTRTKLQKTFRYNNSIAHTAGTFVMQNPEQYQKEVVTHTKVDKSQVILLDSLVNKKEDLSQRVVQILNTIRKNDERGSIAILARYKYLLADAKDKVNSLTSFKNIKYWTFHGSKGLEADYCVLIGFSQGKLGFPNDNKEEAVVEALLPSLDSFPHSEERRLMYVGITRAKKKSYLIADPMASSAFINELLSPKYELKIASSTFEEKYRKIFKCPICVAGYFKKYSGKFGLFYKCSSGKACDSNPRTCRKCDSPSVDGKTKSICNNHNCNESINICDICGREMRQRESKYGKFWGCSGYGIKHDQCKNTKKIIL